MAILAVSGLIITLLAFWGPFMPGIGENAVAVWQSILTNFGVGLISAAVLLLFEPKFRKVVTDSVTTATAGVKEEVLEAVQADLDERLAPLTDRIDSLYDARLAEQEAVINDLARDFTHERVLKTFREASDVSALFNDSIRVQAEDEPGRLHLGLQLRLPDELESYNSPNRREGALEEYKALHLNASVDGTGYSEVIWEPDEDFPVAAMALAAELSRGRFRGLAEKIDWEPVLSRFETGIKTAVDASNKVPGALQMNGALVEVAGPDSDPWYLTTDGLHYPSENWFLPRRHIGGNTGWPNNQPQKKVEKPSWADQKEWNYIIRAARYQFSAW